MDNFPVLINRIFSLHFINFSSTGNKPATKHRADCTVCKFQDNIRYLLFYCHPQHQKIIYKQNSVWYNYYDRNYMPDYINSVTTSFGG